MNDRHDCLLIWIVLLVSNQIGRVSTRTADLKIILCWFLLFFDLVYKTLLCVQVTFSKHLHSFLFVL